LASDARAASFESDDFTNTNGAAGVLFLLDITDATGTTPTLNINVQYKDPISGSYVDIPNAAFAEHTAVASDSLLVYPSATAVADRQASSHIGGVWRMKAVIAGGGPSFTFSLAGYYLP